MRQPFTYFSYVERYQTSESYLVKNDEEVGVAQVDVNQESNGQEYFEDSEHDDQANFDALVSLIKLSSQLNHDDEEYWDESYRYDSIECHENI